MRKREEILLMWSVEQWVALLATMESTGKGKVRGWAVDDLENSFGTI